MAIWERWYPLAGALLAALAYLVIPAASGHNLPSTWPILLSAIITVAGVGLGFLATIKSMLISIDDRPIIQRMKDGGIYGKTVGYLSAAMVWSFWLTLISCAAVLFDYSKDAEWGRLDVLWAAAWLYFAAGALLSYYRISRIWNTILACIDTKHPG